MNAELQEEAARECRASAFDLSEEIVDLEQRLKDLYRQRAEFSRLADERSEIAHELRAAAVRGGAGGVIFAFACNDPDNGTCLERFESVNVLHPNAKESALDLYGPPIVVRFRGRELRVGREVVGCHSTMGWFGNWCWDASVVGPQAALRILRYLVHDRGFEVEGGWTEIADHLDELGAEGDPPPRWLLALCGLTEEDLADTRWPDPPREL